MQGPDVLSDAVSKMSPDELRNMKAHLETGGTLSPISHLNNPIRRLLAMELNAGVLEPQEILVEINRALEKAVTDQK